MSDGNERTQGIAADNHVLAAGRSVRLDCESESVEISPNTTVRVYVKRITEVDVEVDVENSQIAAAIREAINAAMGTPTEKEPSNGEHS